MIYNYYNERGSDECDKRFDITVISVEYELAKGHNA